MKATLIALVPAFLFAADSIYSTTPVPGAVNSALSPVAQPAAVSGRPRVAAGHPRTTWDREDVRRFRELLESGADPDLSLQAAALRARADTLLDQTIDVPQPRRNDAGEFVHVSDQEPEGDSAAGGDNTTGKPATRGRRHNARSLEIADLAAAYLLFDDARYGERCKRMLLAYADAFPYYGVGARPGFSHDPSRVFDQRLSDAIWLLQIARAYDFVHDLPSITPEERAHIEGDLVAADAWFIAQNKSHLRSNTNWGAISTCAILAAGLACDDDALVRRALFGLNADLPEPSEWWTGAPNERPSGVELHFSGRSIDADGLWNEGASGYQFMALQALVCDAEMMWRNGVDLYGHRDCALKRLFDSPLLLAYPNRRIPAVHDSNGGPVAGYDGYLYEYAFLRYRDPAYLPLLRSTKRRLAAKYQQFTVSCLFGENLESAAGESERALPSVNFHGVGFGVARLGDRRGERYLLLDYGPHRSHGHPDKLNIDFWAFGEKRLPDPGIVWYERPFYREWFATTFAHNTLCVNQSDQRRASAELLVFQQTGDAALLRARTAEACPGVVMDRSAFLAPEYYADLFGAFSGDTQCYDLVWHPVGECSGLPDGLAPFAFDAPVPPGYSALRNLRAANLGPEPVRIRFQCDGGATALVPVHGEPTALVVGECDVHNSLRTTIVERRRAGNTVFANVLDVTGDVRATRLHGGVQEGWAAIEVELADGARDFCLTTFRDGAAVDAKPVSTDARQLYMRVRDGSPVAVVLGGGTVSRFSEP